jgi:hypothetical protein
MDGKSVNPMVVYTMSRGGVKFANGIEVCLGAENSNKPYFVTFTRDEKAKALISIYEIDKLLERGGNIVKCSERLHVEKLEEGGYAVSKPTGFKPYDLIGLERISVQGQARKWGYIKKIPAITTKEEPLIIKAIEDSVKQQTSPINKPRRNSRSLLEAI